MPTKSSTSPRRALSDANRLGLDFVAEAARLSPWPYPIIDVHSHLSGARAATVWARAAAEYGVQRVYSMTPLEELDALADVLGERIRFIAIPDFHAPDRRTALSSGYAQRLRHFAARGVQIAKFWSAPRGVDFAEQAGAAPDVFRLDQPHVQANLTLAAELGMRIMVHVGDPDTWFKTHYADSQRYGTKLSQYKPLEATLDRLDVPIIAAHLGGWPENLAFLDGLLARHDNLYLDTSATKWMVRELSRHPREAVVAFFTRWRNRLLFGSDVVTRDAHLVKSSADAEEQKASSEQEAFDLYASRYWALRTLFETDYAGPSPIADPDLHLVDPIHCAPGDAPKLHGAALPPDVLREIYFENAARLLES